MTNDLEIKEKISKVEKSKNSINTSIVVFYNSNSNSTRCRS